MSTNVLQVLQNNARNIVIRAVQESDGTDGEIVTVYDAGSFGWKVKLLGVQYDVQDMKAAMRWDADVDSDILDLGAAPASYDFGGFGGIPVPTGLSNPSGSINVTSLQPTVGASYAMVLHLHKVSPVPIVPPNPPGGTALSAPVISLP